mmetsp:Transcript_19174/g.28096  ORF Transcript_19174/g.28096 Transcript_19174/m.28096 type:complete len:135 (+) Transcript_19174:53-457(+)|eukprot:CAMPEP_0195511956 /NCGR_PEP_ID=MMETSP0794_2-20130614/4094_1 /TAXON_ID=515487 /ORGANISM="Stephanopyxis turris, Strain CCMP 815" /LENGTH=134 /DNA_ID=CAMNT_0040639653 /DNA_START=55 /DNA_END=459 /DNA_ORIENTATION=-
MYTKVITLFALVASASAFAPAAPFGTRVANRAGTKLFIEYGKYDEETWDNDAKKDVYAAWDPNAPRSTMNFNPFETYKGNSPDASGIYPGEDFYKDPIRGDVNFAQMQAEQAEIKERLANPKPGDVPGAPGCKN